MVDTPQARRLERLKARGINQRNILVHEKNEKSFDAIRPSFARPDMAVQLASFAEDLSKSKPTNVSQVRQLSPFRYPGGKTWLIPVVREWMQTMPERPKLLLEPFAGGAIVGLTAAAEGWAEHVKLVELDDDVAAVWSLTIHGSDSDFEKFVKGIETFVFTTDKVVSLLNSNPRAIHKRALKTIVKNRAQRGGIMAPGAGLMKAGENGKGISSRWYPETLARRLRTIRELKDRISFIQSDALEIIEQHPEPSTAQFIDPPYTAGGKRAGSRLYTHNAVDHEQIFSLVAGSQGPAMLTYDDNEWVRNKANEHDFVLATSVMQSTHLVKMHELVILKEQS